MILIVKATNISKFSDHNSSSLYSCIVLIHKFVSYILILLFYDMIAVNETNFFAL